MNSAGMAATLVIEPARCGVWQVVDTRTQRALACFATEEQALAYAGLWVGDERASRYWIADDRCRILVETAMTS